MVNLNVLFCLSIFSTLLMMNVTLNKSLNLSEPYIQNEDIIALYIIPYLSQGLN